MRKVLLGVLLPQLPAGCQWVHLQGSGVDSSGHSYRFQWWPIFQS